MDRRVLPEILDTAPSDAPEAMASRKDLIRINAIMGHVRYFRCALQGACFHKGRLQIAELGAGDVGLALKLATALKLKQPVAFTVVDRVDLVTNEVLSQFKKLGWDPQIAQQDVFEWAQDAHRQGRRFDLILANLFLHHFKDHQLGELLHTISKLSSRFVACEPRRSWVAYLSASRVSLSRHARATFCLPLSLRVCLDSCRWLGNSGDLF